MNPILRTWTAAVLFVTFGVSSTIGQAPDWWTARGVLRPDVQADDYAVINQGQLKHLAHQAYLEMEAKLAGGAGPQVSALVTPWLTAGPNADNYAMVTVGQLKRVAQPFYDRLIGLQLASDYPWTQSTGDDENYALANIGMAKRLFAFTVPEAPPPLVMEALYYQQEMNAGYDAPFGVIAALSQGGAPVSGIAVTFEVVASGGAVFEYAGGALQASVARVSDGSGRAGCGFRAPAEASYCWVRASASGVAARWYLMIVDGGGSGEFPAHPPGAPEVTFTRDGDGDGVTTAVELRLGTDANDENDNPAQHATGSESPFKITFHNWKAGKVEPHMRGWVTQGDTVVTGAEIEEHGWNWPQGSTFPPEDWTTNSYPATIPPGMSAAAWMETYNQPRPPYVRYTYRTETFTDTTYEPPRFEGRVWETVSYLGGEDPDTHDPEVLVDSHIDPWWFAHVIVPQYQTYYWTLPTGGTWQIARVTTHTIPPAEPEIYTGDPTHKYEDQAVGPASPVISGWAAAPIYTDTPLPTLSARGGVIAFEPIYLRADGGQLATAESKLSVEENKEYEDADHETQTMNVYTGAYQSGRVDISWREDWPFTMTEAAKKQWISRFLVVRETTAPGSGGAPVTTTSVAPLSEFISGEGNGGVLATVDPGVPQVGVTKKLKLSLAAVKVVELSPKVKDEDGNDIAGSEKPNSGKPLTPFVEVLSHTNKIAHRELKVLIGSALKNKKVTWTLEALPGATPATIRGEWEDSPTHKDRFEASTVYGTNGFRKVSQTTGETTIGTDGHTAIRVNVPPIGFNQVRIKIQIEGMSTPIDLIDMEVPGVVVVDPGHGGAADLPGSSKNNATSPSGVLEKAMALSYGLAVRDALKAKRGEDKLNLKVYMTREIDENRSGADRAFKARDNGADVIFIIHFNASDAHTARGTLEVVRDTNNVRPDEDTALSNTIIGRMVYAMDAYDSGANHRAAVVNNTAVASDVNNGNTANYHPVRTCYCEVEFIDFGANTAVQTDDLVDILLNTGPNAGPVKTAVANAIRDGILQDLRDQPQQ